MNKKGLTVLVVVIALILSFPLNATATESENQEIVMGSAPLVEGNYVYYLQKANNGNNEPVLWRILGDANDGTANAKLLISDEVQGTTSFANDNAWQGSRAQQWCASYYSNSVGTELEKAQILETSKTDNSYSSFSTSSLSNEKMFFLSAEEVETYFPSNESMVAYHYVEGIKIGIAWWLRSPVSSSNKPRAGIASERGVDYSVVTSNYGARPAFNLNLNAVLFTSSIHQ